MIDIPSLKGWLTPAQAAERLSALGRSTVSQDDVLDFAVRGNIQLSLLVSDLCVWPMVELTKAEEEEFTGTTLGLPSGVRMAADREDARLLDSLAFLDLPICPVNREFLRDIHLNAPNTYKQVVLTPGLVVKLPNPDRYFVVLGGSKIPVRKGDIVVRTDEFKRFQKAVEQQVTPQAPETPEARRARLLARFEELGNVKGPFMRVYEEEKLLNPGADRSGIGKQIKLAKKERLAAQSGSAMYSQLIKKR